VRRWELQREVVLNSEKLVGSFGVKKANKSSDGEE
jgi:hypothetical protein